MPARKQKPSTIRVMHFADTHFGVENYGRLDPKTGLNSRLLDFKRSLCAAIDTALEEGVHVAVFAGDAYKSRDPSQTHQREFAECLRRLTERGVPAVLLTGNHDIPNMRGRAHAMEIWRTLGVDGVHVIGQPERLVVETAAGPVQIAGVPYLMRGFTLARDELLGKAAEEVRHLLEERYTAEVDALAAQCDPALPTILLGHFWVAGARLSTWQQGYFNLNEPQVSVAALAREPFDYVALGHIHRHQDLNRGAYPSVVYSGSPDCIDFGEREERKGFALVDLAKGATSWRFVPTPECRPLLEIEVDADTETPTETVLESIGRHALRGAIVRLTYRISSTNLPQLREKEIREALAPAHLLVGLRREVAREQAPRDGAFTEALEPRAALEQFLEHSDRLRKRKPELMARADLLFEELRREEGHTMRNA